MYSVLLVLLWWSCTGDILEYLTLSILLLYLSIYILLLVFVLPHLTIR